MNTQMNPQMVVRANNTRRATVKEIEGVVREYVYVRGCQGEFELPSKLEADLTLEAPRPSSLGFSEHDLKHFAGFYASLAEEKVEGWMLQNQKIQRMDHPTKAALEERDKRYRQVKVVRMCLDIINGELNRRESLRIEEAREIQALQAEIDAAAAEQQAEIDALSQSVETLKLKVPVKRRSNSTPKKRDEFKKVITSESCDNPFEALKGEVVSRQRENWQSRGIRKSEALELVGGDEEALASALRFAQKMGTDEVMDVEGGVIRFKKHGAAVRYEYYGEAA